MDSVISQSDEITQEDIKHMKVSVMKTFDQLVNIDEKQQIHVEVVNPQIKEDKSGKYTVFLVRGQDQEGFFEVERRYSDFYHFRLHLTQRWPGCYIPPIPSKKLFGNMDNSFVEQRRRFLSYFCKKMSEMKALYYSDESKIFFKSKSQDIENLLNQLPKLQTIDIVERYKHTFSFLSGRSINSDLIVKISNFQTFLQKEALQNLENMKKISLELQNTKQTYSDQFGFVALQILPEYERQVTTHFVPQEKQKNLLVFSQNDSVKTQAKDITEFQKSNTFTILHDFINTETKEVKAFIEALQQRSNYEFLKEKTQKKIEEIKAEIAQLQSGKSTFKSLISKGSKQEQIEKNEKSLQENQAELEQIVILIDLISLILGYIEIDRFKVEKQSKYYDALIRISQQETKLNQKYVGLWSTIQDTYNQKVQD